MKKILLLSGAILATTLTYADNKYTTEEVNDGKTSYKLIKNPNNGAMLSYSNKSGLKILEESDNGNIYAFKDLNNNGKIDAFEDWRLPFDIRAKDLAQKLSIDEIAGLMLFSAHERKAEDGITDDQKTYLKNDSVRNVLNASSNNVNANVQWNNQLQEYVEGLIKDKKIAVPINISSDPRSIAGKTQYNAEGVDISRWPSNLGLAATFNPSIIHDFAVKSSQEYRALGITTALGPQIEIATDPRWLRFDGTFGESTKLAVALTKAFVDGTQSTYENGKDIGWGKESVNAMIKHFPGDGTGESGRESHMNSGKYAVYPTNNFNEHLKPFTEGGLNLDGKTQRAISTMTSYSVAIGANGKPLFMDKKGTSYDAKKMQILRQDYGFDGVVCTDWGVTSMKGDPGNRLPLGMAWGMENENAATRHYEILKLGTDIFGGNNDKKPVLDAYKMWEEAYKKGEVNIPADARFRQSGERILKMFFAPGLFENPYLNLDESKKQVASADKVKAGFDAQVQSLVLVKNKGNVIAKKDINQDFKDKTVYIPSTYWHKFKTVFETAKDEHGHTMDIEIAKKYFKEVLTDEPVLNDKGKVTSFKMPDLSNVDLVIIGVKSPDNGSNFSSAGQNEETGEFYPLSLQYREYIASGDKVRKQSISGDTGQNRTYFNQKSNIGNPYDLQAVLNAKEALTTLKKKVPVLVALKAKNPTIISEFEKEVDAIVVGFGVGDEAYYDVLLGNTEPSGLLPAQFPADMNTVEANLEDKAFDLTPYKDSVGNVYDFAFGLNYKGIIKDDRVKNFK